MTPKHEKQEFITVLVRDPRLQKEDFWHSYIDYEIFIHTNSMCFTRKTSCVRRRFREFVWLRQRLQSNAVLIQLPELPPKTPFFNTNNPQLVDQRRQGLQDFLQNHLVATILHLHNLFSSQGMEIYSPEPMQHQQRLLAACAAWVLQRGVCGQTPVLWLICRDEHCPLSESETTVGVSNKTVNSWLRKHNWKMDSSTASQSTPSSLFASMYWHGQYLERILQNPLLLSDSRLHLFIQTQLSPEEIEACVSGQTKYSVAEAIHEFACLKRRFPIEHEERKEEENHADSDSESSSSGPGHSSDDGSSLRCKRSTIAEEP